MLGDLEGQVCNMLSEGLFMSDIVVSVSGATSVSSLGFGIDVPARCESL